VVLGDGLGFLASPPEGKYPFIYTRDFAVAIVALSEVGDWATARRACDFLLACQQESGEWLQRYDELAGSQTRVIQEDNTPLAVWALLTYTTTSGDQGFEDSIRSKVLKATEFMLCNTLHPHAYLAITHTSIHETEVSEGFEIWNTCAHIKALQMAAEVYKVAEYERYAALVNLSLDNLLTWEGRFLRRLDRHGNPDLRADITLLAPSYFGLRPSDDSTVRGSAALIERILKDPELGGYTRYLTYSELETTVPPGPWFFYTAWMAQYYYALGDRERGDEILKWIMVNSKDFYLPETLTTRSRWERCKDIFRSRLEGKKSARYRAALRREFERLEEQVKERETIYGVLPLLWSHVETLRALQVGGYIRGFSLEA